jgi:hypothetical protein
MLDCQLDKDGNPRPKRPRTKIIGIRQHLEIQRVKQMEKQGPDSWVVRKVRHFSSRGRIELTLHSRRTARGRHRRWNLRVQLLRLRRATVYTYDSHGERPTRRKITGPCVTIVSRPACFSKADLSAWQSLISSSSTSSL